MTNQELDPEMESEVQMKWAYDDAILDTITGDIHLVPDGFLFGIIQERIDNGKRDNLSQIPIADLRERRSTNLFANH